MKACPCDMRGLFVLTALMIAGLLGACTERRDAAYYSDRTEALRAEGFLRTDYAPADAPFSIDDLARSFEEIVFRYEFHFQDGRIIDRSIPKPLKRWQGVIRYGLVGNAVQAEDHATVARLIARITRLMRRTESPTTLL